MKTTTKWHAFWLIDFVLLCMLSLLAVPARAAGEDNSAYQQQFLQLINAERTRNGLSPVGIGSEALNKAATARAAELAQRYSYLRPNDKREFTILGEYGVTDIAVGEDYWAGGTPEEVVRNWMATDFFRSRLLDKNAVTIGVGYYQGGKSGSYWVVIFAYPDHTSNAAFAQEVLDLVNAERASRGLAVLELGDANLTAAAAQRAREIAQTNTHTRPNGTSCFTILVEYGVIASPTGENAAWGKVSPEEAVAAWMNSDGHRANLLEPEARKMSLGYYFTPSSAYGHQWVMILTK